MKHYIQFSALIGMLLAATASTVWSGEYVDVRDYGAWLDGSHDDTTALNNAIAAARSDGRAVYIPPGPAPGHPSSAPALAISSTIVIDGGTAASPTNPVMIEGAGMGVFQEQVAGGNPVNKASTIKWIAAGSGPMIRFIACQGSGFGMKKIKLDGNAAAAYGLEVDHSSYGTFEDVNVGNLSGAAGSWGVKVWTSVTGKTCSWNRFSGLAINVPTGTGGAGLFLTGTGDNDAVHNTFIGTSLVHGGARNGLTLGFCDNNVFVETTVFRRPGGTGTGVVFWYGDPAVGTHAGGFPQANSFFHLAPGAGGVANVGTPLADAKNAVYEYQQNGDNPVPFSSNLFWTEAHRGIIHGSGRTYSLNFGPTSPGGYFQTGVGLAGAAIGDGVTVSCLSTAPPQGIFTAFVSVTNQISVRYNNTSTVTQTPGTLNFG